MFFVAFCSGCMETEAAGAADENVTCAAGFENFRTILHGLADCLACCGNGIEVSILKDPSAAPLFSR